MLTSRPNIATICPQLSSPVRAPQSWKFAVQLSCSDTFEYIHHMRWCISRRTTSKQIHMIRLYSTSFHFPILGSTYGSDHHFQSWRHLSYQYPMSISRYPNKVVSQMVNCMPTSLHFHDCGYNTTRLRGPLRRPHVASRPGRQSSTPTFIWPAFLPGAGTGVSSRRLA